MHPSALLALPHRPIITALVDTSRKRKQCEQKKTTCWTKLWGFLSKKQGRELCDSAFIVIYLYSIIFFFGSGIRVLFSFMAKYFASLWKIFVFQWSVPLSVIFLRCIPEVSFSLLVDVNRLTSQISLLAIVVWPSHNLDLQNFFCLYFPFTLCDAPSHIVGDASSSFQMSVDWKYDVNLALRTASLRRCGYRTIDAAAKRPSH